MPIDPFVGASMIAAGGSLLGGVLGIGGANSSAKKSYKYNRALMAQQQEYARENSATQYARQRELTSDSWLLNKEGMRNAGLNPAFMDGAQNGTANVDQAASPSNGGITVPTPDLSNVVNSGVQNLIAINNAHADNRLKNSQAQLNETKQLTAFQEALADLATKRANAKTAEAKAELDSALLETKKMYEKMSIKNQAFILDNERAMSDIKAFYAPEEYNTHINTLKANLQQAYYSGLIRKKDYESYDKRLSNELLQGQARAALDRAKIMTEGTIQRLNRAKIVTEGTTQALNRANQGLVGQETKNKEQEFNFNQESWSDRLGAIKLSSIPQNLYQKIQLWHKDGTFEKLDGFQQLGYSIYEACSSLGIKPSDAIQLAKLLK